MNLYQWQEDVLKKGFKPGELRVIAAQRQTGKSMIVQQMIRFDSGWTKWKPEWTWKTRVSSRSGKIIWGRIMVRTSKLMISGRGKLVQQRATPKEALTQQKEAFKRVLS